MPVMLTVLPVAAFLSANAPTAPVALRLSPAISPVKLALAVLICAAVLPSYVLLAAVMPLTALMVALSMVAVVLALLLVRT